MNKYYFMDREGNKITIEATSVDEAWKELDKKVGENNTYRILE